MIPCPECGNMIASATAYCPRCMPPPPTPPATSSVGQHPWADSTGQITAKSAGVAVSNMILNAGAKASTAFRCALLISEDIESHPERYKLKTH